MPAPICVKCSREMKNLRAGAVTLTAIAVKGPYQQFQGDLFECPECGVQITAQYGRSPMWEHFLGYECFDRDVIAVAHERGVVQPALPPTPPERD